jgi:predicted transcriptional regulator
MATHGSFQILSDTELEVMQILWARGPAAVRDVHATLYAQHGLAYTTVMDAWQRRACFVNKASATRRWPH